MPLRMRVHDREPIGAALRRFKKLIERSGMKTELRAHEYYEKPCEARRRKEARQGPAGAGRARGFPGICGDVTMPFSRIFHRPTRSPAPLSRGRLC